MFTSHPITGEPLAIIEGSWGLGESVVSGSVSPDKYVFDQRAEKVVDRLISNKKIELIADGGHGTKTVEVAAGRQDAVVLSDEEVAKLAMYGKIAENHYGVSSSPAPSPPSERRRADRVHLQKNPVQRRATRSLSRAKGHHRGSRPARSPSSGMSRIPVA